MLLFGANLVYTMGGKNSQQKIGFDPIFSARGTTRYCKSCSYGCIHVPKKNNQRRRRLIIYYWQLAQRSWFWFWAEWREKLCGNRARRWWCKPEVFKRHLFSAVKESWTLTGGETLKWWSWFKTATLVWLLFIDFFKKKNQAACQTGKGGGKTGRFVGQVELGEQDGLNVKN